MLGGTRSVLCAAGPGVFRSWGSRGRVGAAPRSGDRGQGGPGGTGLKGAGVGADRDASDGGWEVKETQNRIKGAKLHPKEVGRKWG